MASLSSIIITVEQKSKDAADLERNRLRQVAVSGGFQQLLDVFYFFFYTEVAFFNGLFNLVEVHHLQLPETRLDEYVRRFHSQVDAGDALLHDVDGGHDGLDDIRGR